MGMMQAGGTQARTLAGARSENFEALRDRGGGGDSPSRTDGDTSSDDQPRYIH